MNRRIIFGNNDGLVVAYDEDIKRSRLTNGREHRNLIVTLAELHRVVVFVSGELFDENNTNEDVLRAWSTALGDNPLATVQDYQDHLNCWLKMHLTHFSNANDKLRQGYNSLESYLAYLTLEELPDLLTTNSRQAALRECVENFEDSAEILEDSIQWEDCFEVSLHLLLEEMWNVKVGEWIGLESSVRSLLSGFSPSQIDWFLPHLRDHLEVLLRTGTFGERYIRLVVAGYGSEEHAPHISEINMFDGYRSWIFDDLAEPVQMEEDTEDHCLTSIRGIVHHFDEYYWNKLSADQEQAKAWSEGERSDWTDGGSIGIESSLLTAQDFWRMFMSGNKGIASCMDRHQLSTYLHDVLPGLNQDSLTQLAYALLTAKSSPETEFEGDRQSTQVLTVATITKQEGIKISTVM